MGVFKAFALIAAFTVLGENSAGAATIVAASISGVGLKTTGPTLTSVVLSDRMRLASPADIVANGKVKIVASGNFIKASISSTQTPAFIPKFSNAAQTYSATFAYSGKSQPTISLTVTNAKFQISTPAGTAVPSTCLVSPITIVNGGNVGQNFVTVSFTVEGVCTFGAGSDSPAPIAVTAYNNLQIAAVGDLVVTATFRTVEDGNIYDDAPATATLVKALPVYELVVSALPTDNIAGAMLGTANPLPTLFAFDPVAPATEPYTSYLPALAGVRDLVIGSVRATLVPAGPLGATGTLTAPNVAAIWGNMAGDDAPTLSTSLTITPLNGTVQSFSPSLNSAAVATPVQLIAPASFVINSTKDGLKASTVASAGGLLAGNILISAPSGNNVSASMAQSYRATIGLTDPTDRWLASDLKTGPLETTDYEGSTFMAPWFAGSGAQSKTILRIANRGEMVTGKIVLSLASVVKMPGETVRLTTCSPFSSIPKGGEALISTALVTECFGNFVRGDLRISIQALTSALSVKMRILNTNGVVGEQSLGNITLGAQTPR